MTHAVGVHVLAALALAAGLTAQTVITGEVVDVECSIARGAAGRGDAHAACAMTCAREGKPMAILTDDGLYLVVGSYAANKNAKLLDFVGRRVEAKGTFGGQDGAKTINLAAVMVARPQTR